jgi:hypothetical protein
MTFDRTAGGHRLFLTAILTVIVAGVSTSCFAQAARWREVEADNGAIFRVDLNTLFHDANGGAGVTVIEGPDEYARVTQFSFDCRGDTGLWTSATCIAG